MHFRALRFVITALLLAALLVPENLPARHRCACGMSVGCCCLLKAAMKAGDHCALRRASQPCGMRSGKEAKAELQPRRLGRMRPDVRIYPRLAAAGPALVQDEPVPASLASDPPTPPPRPVRAV